MYERFTDRARTVLAQAMEEAGLLEHDFVGTEHILLALIQAGGGMAGMLGGLGLEYEILRTHIVAILGEGQGHVASPELTPQSKKVLEFAAREALQLSHPHIGTEHILLGLIREGEGLAAQAIVASGVELEAVREAVLLLIPETSELAVHLQLDPAVIPELRDFIARLRELALGEAPPEHALSFLDDLLAASDDGRLVLTAHRCFLLQMWVTEICGALNLPDDHPASRLHAALRTGSEPAASGA